MIFYDETLDKQRIQQSSAIANRRDKMVPKFRAWNEKTKSFIDYGDLVLDLESGKVYAGDMGLMDSVIDVTDQIDLMQSTGLKDKNGVEIFEGDILLHTSKSVNYSDTYWHSYVQAYRMDNGAYRIKGAHIYDTELMCARNHLEVVGNIYEQAELLNNDRFMTEN